MSASPFRFPEALERTFKRACANYKLEMLHGNGHFIERILVRKDYLNQKRLSFSPHQGGPKISVSFTKVTPLGHIIIKVPKIVWKGLWPSVRVSDFNERVELDLLSQNETEEFYRERIEGYLAKYAIGMPNIG